ncbi:MAG: hypothetical protein ACREND_09250 [Gemmatimonadaceae bacterium]
MSNGESAAAESRRTGMVLLEVIVGLTILAVSATTMVALADASLRAVARAQAADDAVARADDFFQAVALWPRADLDRHLGDRAEGAWQMRVDRPSRTLYTVTLYDSAGRALLHTSLFRAEEAGHGTP